MILKQIISLVGDQCNFPVDAITEDTTFEELGARDEDLAEIVLAVESEFEVEIDQELDASGSILDLVDLVEQALVVDAID